MEKLLSAREAVQLSQVVNYIATEHKQAYADMYDSLAKVVKEAIKKRGYLFMQEKSVEFNHSMPSPSPQVDKEVIQDYANRMISQLSRDLITAGYHITESRYIVETNSIYYIMKFRIPTEVLEEPSVSPQFDKIFQQAPDL